MCNKSNRGVWWLCTVLLIVSGLLSPASLPAQAQSSDMAVDELRISVPHASSSVRLEAQGGTALFRGENIQYLSQSGEPMLPYQVLKVLLPPDVDLATLAVTLEKEQWEQAPGAWAVAPMPTPVPTCDQPADPILFQARQMTNGQAVGIYNADTLFPATPLGAIQGGYLRKWVLTDVPVALYRYNPVRKELFRLSGGEVVIRFARQPVKLETPTAIARFTDQIGTATVRKLAINFAEMAPAYNALTALRSTPGTPSRYVILTTQAIRTASQQLANFVHSKESRGFTVQVVTENEWGGGVGNVAADRIRQWLQANYLDLNIEYVLLIGDPNWETGDVPMKMLWPQGANAFYNSPSDYYYTDLTGNWDIDGDGFYGEGDDLQVDGVDRNWEVIVGRIPYYGNPVDLDRILAKLVAYENSSAGLTQWRQNVLLPMVPSDDHTPGYQLGEAIKESIVRFKSGWDYHRIYRENYGLTPPPETTPVTFETVANVWKSAPFGAIFWWSHGWSQGAVDVIDVSYAAQLNDTYPGFTFQSSCDNAYPEVPENLAYMLLKNGAIATVGATRVSWYYPGETVFTETASNAGFTYQYAKQLISNEQDSGHALQELKLTLPPNIWMNWTVFNLYGDPAQGLFTARSIVVNSAADPGNGVCDQSECTLREALTLANATPGADSITLQLPGNGFFTIQLTAPLPTITDDLFIAGNGHTVDAQGTGRVFTIAVSDVTIRDLTLQGGRVPLTGPNADSGGAIKLIGRRGDPGCGLTLQASRLVDNEAAAGGAISNLCDASVITITDSLLWKNHALLGGAIYIPTGEELFSELVMRVTGVAENRAEERGGGIFLAGGDAGTNATISDSTFSDNSVANGPGGGLSVLTNREAAVTNLLLRGVTFANNRATSGGGLHIESFGTTKVTMGNSTISGNQAGGEGGGLYMRGVVEYDGTDVRLINSTIANNSATAGGGLYKMDGLLTITNTLIAMNPTGGDCRVSSSPGAPNRYVSGGHNLDSDGSCLPTGVRQPSDLSSANAKLAPLGDNDGPTPTHALFLGSAAINAGDNATCAAPPINGVDQRGIRRSHGSQCDIGAFEVGLATNSHLFVSSASHAKAGGVSFRDEDILAYDLTNHTWQMLFDGSDVGITKDVDAFSLLPDGALLLSFNTTVKVPGLGKVDDSDIVRFIPTTLGNTTAGSFEWYLRGADVGLTTDGEDIDLIDFTWDGQLIVSTIGDFKTPTVSGRDEDLIQLNNAIVGVPSGGDWSFFLDGSRVGLANEDVNGLWRDPGTHELYLTVKDTFAFDDTRIDADDILICTPSGSGTETTCAYRLFWNGDEHDYGSENVESIALGVLPPSFTGGAQASSAESPTPEELAPDDDIDDLNLEELIYQLYLPVVQQ